MTIEEMKEIINTMTRSKGYFINGYNTRKKIGKIYPIAYGTPELGNCLILEECSEKEWRGIVGFTPKSAVGYYYYKVMVD